MLSIRRISHLCFFLSCWIGFSPVVLLIVPFGECLSSSSLPSFSTSFATSSTSSPTKSEDNSSSSSRWKPKISSLEERKFLRNRGKKRIQTETIGSIGFHHVEFYCGDARSMANHFSMSLGMSITGTTGQSTGNDRCVSYALESGDRFRLLLTAPYSRTVAAKNRNDIAVNNMTEDYDAPMSLPGFDLEEAHNFFGKHGLAVRAVGIEVTNSVKAFEESVANGAAPVLEPTFLPTCPAQIKARRINYDDDNASTTIDEGNEDGCWVSEVSLYGDVVLRYLSFTTTASNRVNRPFLPHLAPLKPSEETKKRDTDDNDSSFGIYKIDHVVGNVHNLQEEYSRIQKFTGFHEFAEFTSEDVGTVDSGLNSVVLASDSEEVLLPINEPTNGRRKSQIQTYLEQNEGSGVQHIALKTKDIFSTIRKMRQLERGMFGFELMKQPSDAYYQELPGRLGDQLTPTQYEQLEEFGILADSDEEGILLQVFTKPVGDRPTFFFEIIQRIGCVAKYDDEEEEEGGEGVFDATEQPGCGGFGQGNFRELFKSIEDHEKTLKV